MIPPTYTSEKEDLTEATKFFYQQILDCPEWSFISLLVIVSLKRNRIQLEFGTLEWPNGLLTVTGMYVALDPTYLGLENGLRTYTLSYSGIFQSRVGRVNPHPHCYPSHDGDAPMCTPKRGYSFSGSASRLLLQGDVATLVSEAQNVVMSINWGDTYRHDSIDLVALRRALRDPNDPHCSRCGSETHVMYCAVCMERGCTRCGELNRCGECRTPICNECSIDVAGWSLCSERCGDIVTDRLVECVRCENSVDPHRNSVDTCEGCGANYCSGCSYRLTYCHNHDGNGGSVYCPHCRPSYMIASLTMDRPKIGVPYGQHGQARIRVSHYSCNQCDAYSRQNYCLFCGHYNPGMNRHVHFDAPELGTRGVCENCAHHFVDSSLNYYLRDIEETDVMVITSIYNLVTAGDKRFPPIVSLEDKHEIRISRHAVRPDDEPASWVRLNLASIVGSENERDDVPY